MGPVFRWDFLCESDPIDVCAAKGLKKLEQFFQSKYEEVEEKEANASGEERESDRQRHTVRQREK